jgi:hypothetical protein
VLVRVPEMPVMTTVKVPVAAAPRAVRVNTLELLVLLGLNVAVTPLGNADADKLTLALKPFCEVTVTLLVPLAPWKTLRLLGDADNVKLPALFTARVMMTVLVRKPDVPATVTLTTPMLAALLAVNVSVLLFRVLAGLNEAITPLGRPDADKLTLLAKPFCGLTVIVVVPLPPRVMLRLLAEAEREKLGMGPPVGQLLTRFVALTVPIPVAKSQPVIVPYAGLKELLALDRTPCVPGPEGS